jgi:Raf kinase inhibitor-like YbhB/YbcL family protein
MRPAIICLITAILTAVPVADAISKEVRKMDKLRISSPVFEDSGSIPAKYTCDGANVNPPLVIDNVPAGAKALALIVDDPDAPVGMWVHWVMWNIEPKTGAIGEDSVPAGAQQGKNDWRRNDYGGPCPPSGTHRYFFKLYALDAELNLPATTTKTELEKAMAGHVLGQAQIIGLYKRR